MVGQHKVHKRCSHARDELGKGLLLKKISGLDKKSPLPWHSNNSRAVGVTSQVYGDSQDGRTRIFVIGTIENPVMASI